MPYDGNVADFVETNTVADVLRRAKALIPDEDHWFQGSYGRKTPGTGWMGKSGDRVCVAMAFTRAVGKRGPDDPLWWQTHLAFTKANGVGNVETVDWNNADERVFADIHPALDRAIELAERT